MFFHFFASKMRIAIRNRGGSCRWPLSRVGEGGQGCILIWSEDRGRVYTIHRVGSKQIILRSLEAGNTSWALTLVRGRTCAASFGNIESRTRTWGGARDSFHMSNPHPPKLLCSRRFGVSICHLNMYSPEPFSRTGCHMSNRPPPKLVRSRRF